MEENNVIALRQPGDIADPLTEALRSGARALLAQAVEAEVAEALAAHSHLTTDDGRQTSRAATGKLVRTISLKTTRGFRRAEPITCFERGYWPRVIHRR